MEYIVFIIISVLFCNVEIYAQNYSALPQETKYETNITEPLTLRKGCWQTSLSYSYQPFVDRFLGNGKRSYWSGGSSSDGTWYFSGSSLFTTDLGAGLSYGISNSLQIGVSLLSYSYTENIFLTETEFVDDNYVEDNSNIIRTKGFGDISTSLHYQFINKPTFYSSVYLGTAWPIKKHSIKTGVNLKKIFYPFSLSLLAGYIYTPGYKDSDPFYGSAGGIGVGILLNSWFTIGNSWTYSYGRYKNDPAMPSMDWIYSKIDINQQVKRFRFSESISFPVAGHNAINNMSLDFTTSFKF